MKPRVSECKSTFRLQKGRSPAGTEADTIPALASPGPPWQPGPWMNLAPARPITLPLGFSIYTTTTDAVAVKPQVQVSVDCLFQQLPQVTTTVPLHTTTRLCRLHRSYRGNAKHHNIATQDEHEDLPLECSLPHAPPPHLARRYLIGTFLSFFLIFLPSRPRDAPLAASRSTHALL